MAMLAEPRRKQKLSINPRGNNWSNDNNKFGQKLMEKFGWTKGKGLGANEDGKVDHVKVSVKTDQRGVGCSVSHADNWIAHQDDFNSILENLNQSNTDSQLGSTPGEVISLETKSKNSKGRMHYKKFAKGKDLSSRTTEDLNCIFGVRKTKSGDNTPQCISEENSDCESQRENEDSGGLKTIRSSDSVQEYFAKKMAALKKSRTNPEGVSNEVTDIKVSSAIDEYEKETKDENVHFILGEDSNEIMQNASKKSKKKKKKKKEEKDKSTLDPEENKVDRCMEDEEIKENGDTSTEDGSDRLKNGELSSRDLVHSDEKKKDKKSKKRKREDGGTDDRVTVEDGASTIESEEPLKMKKKNKKKKKDKNSESEENFDLQIMENNSGKIKEEPKNICKLKKSKAEDSYKTENTRTEDLKELHVDELISEMSSNTEKAKERKSSSIETGLQGNGHSKKQNDMMEIQKTKIQKVVDRKTKAIVKKFKKKGANVEDITGYMCASETGNAWVTEERLKRTERNRKRKLRESIKHASKKKKV